jgi:ABC-2 type transport system permease protein
MTTALVRKLLRDIWLPLVIVGLLLAAFQFFWAKISQRITEELVPAFTKKVPLFFIRSTLFEGPGQLMQTLMGGESINFAQSLDMVSIGYVHPLVATILCIWAIGRAAGAVAGEIDRGTMELLLAQPLARARVILAHFYVDLLTIPVLCLFMWGGNWLGIAIFGRIQFGAPPDTNELRIDPRVFAPALLSTATLLFAVSGFTMWLSARGRFRNRVLGLAVLLTLIQFLVNVIGQLWDGFAPLRPFTVFYYYLPQPIILRDVWTVNSTMPWNAAGEFYVVNGLAVLLSVGVIGYGLALWTFCRRDLPAPL